MDIEFKKINKSEVLICDDYFDTFSNIKIRIHSHCGILLELEDFYGEFTISDLEKILSKMKELQNEKT